MDLAYSDDQRLFAQNSDSLLAGRAGKKNAPDLWSQMAELGWLGLPLPEAYGGLGQGAVEVGIIAESFGRHLVGTPYIPYVVLCGSLVAALGDETLKQALLPAMAEGRSKVALAHAEQHARHDLRNVAATARRDTAGWRLTGSKIGVLGGAEADKIILAARISGEPRAAAGIGLFLVDRQAPGLNVEGQASLDGGSAARLAFDDLTLPANALLGGNEDAFDHLAHAFDRAIAAWCAECVGMMEAATAATVAYTKIRIQFGKPLAMNQVLRHRMADMSIHCEEARSMALRAALHADSDDPIERGRAISGAWAKVSRGARFVAEQAIQLHGAMGVTDELDIGSYLKRIIALDAVIGGADHHLRRHATLSNRAARTGEIERAPVFR